MVSRIKQTRASRYGFQSNHPALHTHTPSFPPDRCFHLSSNGNRSKYTNRPTLLSDRSIPETPRIASPRARPTPPRKQSKAPGSWPPRPFTLANGQFVPNTIPPKHHREPLPAPQYRPSTLFPLVPEPRRPESEKPRVEALSQAEGASYSAERMKAPAPLFLPVDWKMFPRRGVRSGARCGIGVWVAGARGAG